MNKDDITVSQLRELCPIGLDKLRCNLMTKTNASERTIKVEPQWRKRYQKKSSNEKLKVEDEIVLDFLTHARRRNGFFGRNNEIKNVAQSLNRLEKVMEKPLATSRHKGDREKVSFYVNADFLKCIEDFSQKNGYLSVQDAIRWMLREYLDISGSHIGPTLKNKSS